MAAVLGGTEQHGFQVHAHHKPMGAPLLLPNHVEVRGILRSIHKARNVAGSAVKGRAPRLDLLPVLF
jgi:hypothetical protein